MLKRLRHCRIVGLVTVTFFASACVTTSNRIPPETFNAMTDAEVFIVRAQQEIDILLTEHPIPIDQRRTDVGYVHVPAPNVGGGGAAAAGIMLGVAAIAIAVSNSIKRKKANKFIFPVQEAIPDAKIEERLKSEFDTSLRSIRWIKPVPVQITDESKFVVLEEKLYTSKADAVGIFTPYYLFNYSMTVLRVGLRFELFSASKALTKVVGNSQSQPVPFYAVHRFWDVSIPANKQGEAETHAVYWSADNGKHTRAALAEGIEYTAAQIHETLSDPQVYKPNQSVVKKPTETATIANSFRTIEERNNWYAIRYKEIENSWYGKKARISENCGEDSKVCSDKRQEARESVKRELNALATECRTAPIGVDNEGTQNVEGCAVSQTLAKLSPTVSAARQSRPPRKEFYKLTTDQIQLIFKDTRIDNYPDRWLIEFSPNGKWEGVKHGSRMIHGYGTWSAKNDMHCLVIDDHDAYAYETVEPGNCYQVWVNEEKNLVKMVDPRDPSHPIIAKEDAYAEIDSLMTAAK